MKNLSILFFLFVCTLLPAQTSLSGKITDAASGEELIAANVTFFKGGVVVTGVATDFEGNYGLNLDPGIYDVETSYTGYQTKKVVGVIVKVGKANTLDIHLRESKAMPLDEVAVVEYSVHLADHEKLFSGESESIRELANKRNSSDNSILPDSLIRKFYAKDARSEVSSKLQKSSLSGKITDEETGEQLIAANLNLFKDGVLITGLATDFEGNYKIVIDPGTYDVEVSYVGYQTRKIPDVVVKVGQANKLDVGLSVGDAIMLEEISVIEYKVPLIKHDHTTSGATLTSDDIRKLASKDDTSAPAAKKSLHTASEGDGITVRSSRTTASAVSVDTEKAAPSFPPKAEATFSDDAIIKSVEKGSLSLRLDGSPAPAAPAPPSPSVEAGQLTAGEWKDLDNWTFWQNLLADAHFSNYQTHWNYHPQQRFSVKVSDEFGRALANIPIQLLNQDGVKVWESKSDNKGGAELWGNFFGGTDAAFTLKIQQESYEQTFRAINYTEGINSLMIQTECTASKEVDVVFVVDVTGSMGDELKYLKAEAMDLIQRAEEEVGITLRTGAVCYTDRTEDNTLRTIPFSEKETETIAFLQNQSLGSGGDYPEAVDLGLGHAINNMDWNENAIARIVFVMLDAPPHHVEEELKSLEKSIQVAAAKGIKIIPIASSGLNKETEFLLKFFAMATNGTYTFLTDHSGIGNPHIKPEAGDYNIETLNDLMVRLIEESSEYHDCAPVEQYIAEGATKQKLSNKERRDDAIKVFDKQIKCFPNPATDYVFVDLEEDIDLLLVTDGGGKMVLQLPELEDGQVRIDVGDWAGGVYFFHFYRAGVHVVEKVVVSGEGDEVVKK